jgi:hypothetical protein
LFSPFSFFDRSLNYHSGIAILEELLLIRRKEMSSTNALALLRARKKSSGRSQSMVDSGDEASGYDEAHATEWLQLARLVKERLKKAYRVFEREVEI